MIKTFKNMNTDNKGKNNEVYTRKLESDKLVNCMNKEGYNDKDLVVWCPFDKEDSNIVKSLKENGYNVIYTHIDDGYDFLEFEPDFVFDIMISNPPFSKRTKFFNKINSYNKPYIMLQPIMFFNNNSMIRELVKDSDRYRFLMPNNRMGFIKEDDEGFLVEKDKTTSFYSFWLCKDCFMKKKVFNNLEE